MQSQCRERPGVSVREAHARHAAWEPLGIGFLSAQEGCDPTTALDRLLLNLLASLAEFELELIRERVTAGMGRAKAQGKAIGRPGRLDDPAFRQLWEQPARSIADGRLSRRGAAQRLGCGEATVRRLLAAQDGR